MSHVSQWVRYPYPKSHCYLRVTELNNKNIYICDKLRQTCATNWGSLFYYKLGQTLLQIREASLLQIGANVVTNWGSYYKLGQPSLQNREAITNWGKT